MTKQEQALLLEIEEVCSIPSGHLELTINHMLITRSVAIKTESASLTYSLTWDGKWLVRVTYKGYIAPNYAIDWFDKIGSKMGERIKEVFEK